MCRLAGRRCPSSQGPAGPAVYATRSSNRKYRRDLAALVRDSGNPELAAQIMQAPFTAMPLLTESAGLCAEDVSTAPLPGQTANYAINSSDKKLAKQVGIVAADIAEAADATDITHPTPDEVAEKSIEDIDDITAMSREALDAEEETLARRIDLLGVQADKADERGKFRLAESIDREIAENEARLEQVRREMRERDTWTEEDEEIHQEHLESMADPYYVPDRLVEDKLAELYGRDPNYITGVSTEALQGVGEMFDGDDEESRVLRAAALNELVRRGETLTDTEKGQMMGDMIARNGLFAHNALPGTDKDDANELLYLYADGDLDGYREALTDPMSDDPEVLAASRDRLQDLSAASRGLAESLEIQAEEMSKKDRLSGPMRESKLDRSEVRALAEQLRTEADAFDAASAQITEHAAGEGLELSPEFPQEGRDERAAQKVHDLNSSIHRADPDEIDEWLDSLMPKTASQFSEMSDSDLRLETAKAVADGDYTGGSVEDLARESLARTGSVPEALAVKALEEKVRTDGFSIFHSPDGAIGNSGVILAAGYPDAEKSLDRMLHAAGQTQGLSGDKIKENWNYLDGVIASQDSAEKLLRDQAALMGPDDTMGTVDTDEALTRDQVLERADKLAAHSDRIREARKSLAAEYSAKVGDPAEASRLLQSERQEREQARADHKMRVENYNRRMAESGDDADPTTQEELRKARQHIAEMDKATKPALKEADAADPMEKMLAELDARTGELPSGSKALRMLQSDSLRTTAGDEEAEGLRAEYDRVSELARPSRSPKYAEVVAAEKQYARDDLDAARELRDAASKLDEDGILVIPNPDYTPDSDEDPEGSLTRSHAMEVAEKAEKAATKRLVAVEKLQDRSQYPENLSMYTGKAAKVLGKSTRPTVAGIAEEARKIDPIPYNAEISKATTVEEYVAGLEAAKKRNTEYANIGNALRGVTTACGTKNAAEGKDDRAAIRDAHNRLLENRGNELWLNNQLSQVTGSLDTYATLSSLHENAPKAFKDARKKVDGAACADLESVAGRNRYQITAPAGGWDREDPETLSHMFYDDYSEFTGTKLGKKIEKELGKAGGSGGGVYPDKLGTSRTKNPDNAEVASKVLATATPKEVDDYAETLWCSFQNNARDAENEVLGWSSESEEAAAGKSRASAYLLSRRERFTALQSEARKDPRKLVDLYHLSTEYPDEIYDLDAPDRVLPPEGMSPLFDLPEVRSA